jgi:carbon-monoxide dehydrogenase medium subunit
VVDKPAAGVAVRVTLNADATIQTARIVLGCVGATPVRARKAETLLTGKKISSELAQEAGSIASQECTPTGDLRGSEMYKRAIVRTLVGRAVLRSHERSLQN